MADWARIANTTIHQYVREVEDNIFRDRKILAMMRQKGRITFNSGGDLLDWKVRYKRAPIRVFRESDTLTFARVNRWKTAQLDWRGYAATDSVTKLEKLKNKDTEAIVKFVSEIMENLASDLEENFGDELYVDGTLAANAGRIHGFESFLGTSGTQTHGYVGSPNSTYAGLLCTLGNYGGSWSLDGSSNIAWPDGTGDPEYDFWSPLIIDYTNASFSAATKTWPNTCTEALRYGINKLLKNKGKGRLSQIFLERELYRQSVEKIATSERLLVQRGERKDGLYALGFLDTYEFDGVEITSEYGVPLNAGYGPWWEYLQLRSMQDRLFVPNMPDFDIASYSERYAIDFFGNMQSNPRYFLAFKKIS